MSSTTTSFWDKFSRPTHTVCSWLNASMGLVKVHPSPKNALALFLVGTVDQFTADILAGTWFPKPPREQEESLCLAKSGVNYVAHTSQLVGSGLGTAPSNRSLHIKSPLLLGGAKSL